jgi:hypothetical protein
MAVGNGQVEHEVDVRTLHELVDAHGRRARILGGGLLGSLLDEVGDGDHRHPVGEHARQVLEVNPADLADADDAYP